MSTEESCGITVFANTAPGFRGILKQRYSDFVVHEVGLDGAVVRLSSLVVPGEAAAKVCKVCKV